MDLTAPMQLLLVCVTISLIHLAQSLQDSNSEPRFNSDHAAAAADRESYEHIKRLKRAPDVSQIRHLYDEDKISWHTEEEKIAIVAKHLEYRRSTFPVSASDMEYMYWDDDLARLAGLWASVCHWGHGITNHTDESYGQNLWLGGSKPDGQSNVASWHNNEIGNWNYDTKSCASGRVCGHYTQVVWAASVYVGCARAYCPELIDLNGDPTGKTEQWIEACQYSPGGNYAGASPFQSGTPCNECASGAGWCIDNMCVSECPAEHETCECRQECNNCGTFLDTCECACMDGWYGTSCSKVCVNTHTNCGKSPGWPSKSVCGAHPAIPRGCPLMCEICEAAGDETCGTAAPTEPTTTTTTKPRSTTPLPTDGPCGKKILKCLNGGEFQTSKCRCKCKSTNTGTKCERKKVEVESGVELLFVQKIEDFTEEFERMLHETVAKVVTVFCNKKLKRCCDGASKNKESSRFFDFINYNHVVTALGYPTVSDTNPDILLTMVVIQVPTTTDLCVNGTQAQSTRRKRDADMFLHRDRRADGDIEVYLPQDVLLELITENLDNISSQLNVTIDSVAAGVVTEESSDGRPAWVVPVAIVMVLLVVVIITIIVIIVIKRPDILAMLKQPTKQDKRTGKVGDDKEKRER